MTRNLGIGAAFALTAAAIAIGCSTKKTYITSGQSSELGVSGFPASSIATNNLAPDGGGFSGNDQDADRSFTQYKCAFNVPQPDSATTSTASTSTADGSAMVVFATTSHAGGRQRVFAAYWNGQSFTPPVEITAANRDETITSGDARATHVNATVLIPINTAGYNDPSGASPSLTRANQGNWLILWDGQTVGAQANPGTGSGVLSNLADLNGPHHTVFATVFVKSLSGQPSSSTKLIGNTAATGTPTGTSQNLQYGFQVIGNEITAEQGGAQVGGTSAGTIAAFTDSGGANLYRPASDVVSFGAASDTFVHCASFGSTTNDVSGLSNGGKFGASVTYGATATTPSGGFAANLVAVPDTANYEIGDSTTFIQLFWVQLVTSHGANAGGQFQTATNTTATIQAGPAYQMFTAAFSLETMTIGGASNAGAPTGQSIITPPASRNTFADVRQAESRQVEANFVTYNNMLFYNWLDASLVTVSSAAASNNVGSPGVDVNRSTGLGSGLPAVSTVLSVLTVTPAAQPGSSTASGANEVDITMLGTAPRHSTANSPAVGVAGIEPGEEQVSLNSLCKGCGIIGPDEGQADVVIFTVGRVSTFTSHGVIATAPTRAGATTSGNMDAELWATLITAQGVLETGGTNPRRVSEHFPELTATQTTGVSTNLTDQVGDVKIQSSRDGTYNIIAYRQVVGNSQQAQLALNAVCYKVAYVGSGSISNASLPTLDARLTQPVQVNAAPAGALLYSTVTFQNNGFTAVPIVGYDFQGHIGYRCGFQSDATKMSVLYVAEDGSNERLFIRQLQVTLGTSLATAPVLALGTEAEIEPTASVNGQMVNRGNVVGVQHSVFNFLPGSFGFPLASYQNGRGAQQFTGTTFAPGLACTSFSQLDSADAGPAPSGAGGDVLVVFAKVVNASLTVGSAAGFDTQVIGVLYSAGAVSPADRIVLSRPVAENTQGGQPITLPVGTVIEGTQTIPLFTPNTKVSFSRLLPNAASSSVTPGSYAPSNGSYAYFTDFVGANASSPSGIFTRHFRARRATQNAAVVVTFVNNWFPASGAEPVRIDNAQIDADASFIDILVSGTTAMVFFNQDNHIWATQTSDGETYTNKNGLPSAFLVDDNFSANQALANTVSLGICKKPASTCDNLHGSILAVIKDDVNQDARIYIRVMQ